MTRVRSSALGPAIRPVAVPDDLDRPGLIKADGSVELPVHIRWSLPSVAYDLDNRADAIRVYEQVMREGTEEDVRYFIDPARLVELWRDLVLPPYVRRA
jgi:hypothetical protein